MSSALLPIQRQATVVLVQGLHSGSHPQPEAQDEVLQSHGAADLIFRIEEPEQQGFLLPPPAGR